LIDCGVYSEHGIYPSSCL